MVDTKAKFENIIAMAKTQTLEEKILRLKEIYELLENKKANISESMGLLEEAYGLKSEIEKELETMENKLITLSGKKSESESW